MDKKFTLSRTDRKLAGVCGGIAEYFSIDPLLVRLAWVVFTLCGGCGILAYILLWILAPLAPHQSKLDDYIKQKHND